MVDDDQSFRELSTAAALDADLKVVTISTQELIARRGDELPDGAMLDGAILTGPRRTSFSSGSRAMSSARLASMPRSPGVGRPIPMFA
jgi:hypothetical protein